MATFPLRDTYYCDDTYPSFWGVFFDFSRWPWPAHHSYNDTYPSFWGVSLVFASLLVLLWHVPLFWGVFQLTGPPMTHTPLFWFTCSPTMCTPLFEGFFWFTSPPMTCTPLFEGFFFGFSRPTTPKMTYTPLQGVFFLVLASKPTGPPLLWWCVPLFLRGFLSLIFFDNNNPSGCLSLHL